MLSNVILIHVGNGLIGLIIGVIELDCWCCGEVLSEKMPHLLVDNNEIFHMLTIVV